MWTRASIRALAARYPKITENALSIAGDYLDWYIGAHLALSLERLEHLVKSGADRAATEWLAKQK